MNTSLDLLSVLSALHESGELTVGELVELDPFNADYDEGRNFDHCHAGCYGSCCYDEADY